MPKLRALIHKKHCMQSDQRLSNLLSCFWGQPVTGDHISIKYKACIQRFFSAPFQQSMDFLNWQFLLDLALMNALSPFLKKTFLLLAARVFCSSECWVHCVVWKRTFCCQAVMVFLMISSSDPNSSTSDDHLLVVIWPYSLSPCHLWFHRPVYVLGHHFFKLQFHRIHSCLLYGNWLTPLSSCSLALFQFCSLRQWRSGLFLFLQCVDWCFALLSCHLNYILCCRK